MCDNVQTRAYPLNNLWNVLPKRMRFFTHLFQGVERRI